MAIIYYLELLSDGYVCSMRVDAILWLLPVVANCVLLGVRRSLQFSQQPISYVFASRLARLSY